MDICPDIVCPMETQTSAALTYSQREAGEWELFLIYAIASGPISYHTHPLEKIQLISLTPFHLSTLTRSVL